MGTHQNQLTVAANSLLSLSSSLNEKKKR